MKKLISISMLLLAFSLVFISCSRDEDTSTSNNGFIQVDNGSKLSVSNASVVGIKAKTSADENYYLVNLVNVSGTVSKTATLAIFFPYNQSIDGTYSITSTTRKLDDWLTNYSEISGTSVQQYNDLSQGTCTVKRNSTDSFTLSFSFKTSTGKTINGEYNGKVTVQETN